MSASIAAFNKANPLIVPFTCLVFRIISKVEGDSLTEGNDHLD
jgi:hypothetical protein